MVATVGSHPEVAFWLIASASRSSISAAADFPWSSSRLDGLLSCCCDAFVLGSQLAYH